MDERIKQELLRILLTQRQNALAGAIIVTLITTFSLWSEHGGQKLMLWSLATIGLLLLRWYLSNGYDRLSVDEQNAQYRYWSNQFTLGSLSNGILWGIVTFLFFSSDPLLLSLIIVVHAGYIGGAASATSILLPTFLAFSVSSSILFTLGIIINGGWDYLKFVVLISFYEVIMIFFAIRNNRSVANQVALRLQNAELLADLREQRDKAETAMIAKNRFLAAASHDLRQPVHALGLFVASLESHQEFEERQYILSKIKQTTAALAGLFHGLLDISKLDANVVENEPEDYPLNDLLYQIRDQFLETARLKDLTLLIKSEDNLVAWVDPSLLERILANLVSNAVNHTDTGSVTISAQLNSNNKIDLQVKDTGKGIPESEHERIFSEYHQLDNPERDRQKGLGLGLAIVRRLSQLMSVPITVSSKPGEGSVFTVTIPTGDPASVVTATQFPEPENHAINVLVIDDEVDILEGMQKILDNWGCNTVTATSTAEAIAALDGEAEPDVILADFRLRGNESGLDAIQSIREEYNWEIPAILVTGDTDPERLKQATRSSVELLHKPVEPAILRQILCRFIPPGDIAR
ncbi:MAG: hybrid sensor histidine kinase/response regulator [Granulosicoccus sp.]|nr:hybrid sensor histidine kinase/response regulator [Granulosicoccus sp.]